MSKVEALYVSVFLSIFFKIVFIFFYVTAKLNVQHTNSQFNCYNQCCFGQLPKSNIISVFCVYLIWLGNALRSLLRSWKALLGTGTSGIPY